jgi:TPR repeat protein
MHGQGIADVFRSGSPASLPKITLGLLLALSGCALPNNGAPGRVFAPRPAVVQAAENEFRSALAEERAGDSTDALTLLRQVGAASEVEVAFAGFSDPNPKRVQDLKDEYAQVLALARGHIGMAYEYGSGVSQDFSMAVYWYRTAAETESARGGIVGPIFGAVQGEALLFAYGLGGLPRDRDMARRLLVESHNDTLVTLLDNDALPRTIRGNGQFFQDVKVAWDAMKQRQAEGLAEAFRAGARNTGQGRSTPAQQDREPGWGKCNVLPSPFGYADVPVIGAIAGCSPW